MIIYIPATHYSMMSKVYTHIHRRNLSGLIDVEGHYHPNTGVYSTHEDKASEELVQEISNLLGLSNV